MPMHSFLNMFFICKSMIIKTFLMIYKQCLAVNVKIVR